jgi:hypothetical protein
MSDKTAKSGKATTKAGTGGRQAGGPSQPAKKAPRPRKDPVVKFWEEHAGALGKGYKLDY